MASKRKRARTVVKASATSTPLDSLFKVENVAAELAAMDVTYERVAAEVRPYEQADMPFHILGQEKHLNRAKSFAAKYSPDGTCFPLYDYGADIEVPVRLETLPMLAQVVRFFSERYGLEINHIVVNRYRHGTRSETDEPYSDYIGEHHDKNKHFVEGTPIVTLTLLQTPGAARVMRLTPQKQGTKNGTLHYRRGDVEALVALDAPKHDLVLAHGDTVSLSWLGNLYYKHEILAPSPTRPVDGERISITMRCIGSRARVGADGKAVVAFDQHAFRRHCGC